MEFQHTIAQAIEFSGKGIHFGQVAHVKLLPAPENFGIRFKRVDLDNAPEIKALAENVTHTQRSTTLEKEGVKVQTVEHLMAALYAVGIDNVLIEIDAQEVPIYDGSALQFVQTLKATGLQKQSEERLIFTIDAPLTFTAKNGVGEIVAIPDEGFKAWVNIAYPNTILHHQSAELKNLNDFETEIAGARTFCLLSELDRLLQHNLIQGGNLENAVVYVDKLLEDEQIGRLQANFALPHLSLEVGKTLNNAALRFQNEAARHKLLDFIGDLALVGYKINARFYATCPGHTLNTNFAKYLSNHIKNNKHLFIVPQVDLSQPPIYDIHAIEKMLPHRYPFLLVDKIMKVTPDEIIGIKNLTFNEAFFQGHFPGNAIMPGVLQIEAMAQTGGILALSSVPDPENYWTYFLRIDQTRFRHPVRPGDTAIFQLKLLKPIRRGIVEMKASTFVGNNLVTEAVLTAQIVRKDA